MLPSYYPRVVGFMLRSMELRTKSPARPAPFRTVLLDVEWKHRVTSSYKLKSRRAFIFFIQSCSLILLLRYCLSPRVMHMA